MRTKRIISNSLIISSLTYLSIEFISILKSKAKLKGYFHTISELSINFKLSFSIFPLIINGKGKVSLSLSL